MLTAFSLSPTDNEFFDIERFCRSLLAPVTDQSISTANVDHQLYVSLLDLLACLRVPELDLHIGWDNGLKLAAVRHLEQTGLRYDVMTNVFIAADKAVDGRLGHAAKVPVCVSGVMPGSTAGPTSDEVLGGKRELGRNTAPSAGGFTLDDIQQVLSAANCPLPGVMSNSVACGGVASGASDASVDERALKEITAYLQSEIGSHKVPQDVSGRPLDFCAYNAGPGAGANPSTATNQDSGLVVRLIPPAGNESRSAAASHHETRPATDAGGTILVTDSNLPYLQQFLPNLQTVMQSVQSLVRCAPPSSAGHDATVNSVASNTQQRSMSLPALATCKNSNAQTDPGTSSSHKKRKRSGHSNQSKPENAAAANVNLFALPFKDLPNKSGDLAQTKLEPDSATSTGEGGFVCGLCSRTFSKRLGLSVHIQRAHGHRRSSESVELSHDVSTPGLQFADKPALHQPASDGNTKNCFIKMARVDPGCSAVGETAGHTDVAAQSASAVSMCDGCGEIVARLDTHKPTCAGRQSPAKFVGQDSSLKVEKCEPVPAVSANTAVVEMLQLAEHFLRQHVSTASVVDQSSFVGPGADQVHMLSPPPYSEAEMHLSSVMPAAVGCSRFPTNGLGMPTELPTQSIGGTAQPPGKEIVYEGSRMREFVEYQCEACLLTFNSSELANTHVAHHHTSASVSAYRVYACLSCSLRYRDPRIMRHHVVYLCGGSRQQADAQSKQQLFPCSFCSKTFMSIEYMQLHIRLRHAGHAVSSVAAPVQCVLPTPSGATSVPSLDQLVSQFRRHPTAVPISMVNINQAGANAAGIIPAVNQESTAHHKEQFVMQNAAPVVSVPHGLMPKVDGSKAVSHQSVVDGRQLSTAPTACEAAKSRSSKAKGIFYKNVFMQCEGTYFCSVCHADLTGRESKRRHRQLPCGDPKTASYSRRYSYVCPYCSERFPSQKLCRQHQIDECLPHIGVGTADLGVGEHRCPLCPRTCFGIPALKGHIMQAHHLPKEEVSKLLSVSEHDLAVPTGATLAVDNTQEFNGVLSPAISSPSSTLSTPSSAFMTQKTASPGVHSLYDSTANVSHGDSVESDDDIPEPAQSKDLFPQLYETIVGDNTHRPAEDIARPKRNRKARSNEFFVMMFRNYPILAKGVSMCRSCAAQLEASATTESHASSCTGSAAADVRRSTLFRCTHCTTTFWRAKDCRTHQLESCLPAHGVKIERLTEPSVACPMCEVRSYNRSGLMSHMKFRHSLDTDGVRQVMDRCGIRKSVPPAADNIVATASPADEYEDGSLLMDDMQGTVACDGMMPMQCSSLADTTQSSDTAPDILVDGISAGCVGDDLPVLSDDNAANDSINTTWRTANVVLQQSSAADLCTDLNN